MDYSSADGWMRDADVAEGTRLEPLIAGDDHDVGRRGHH